jgi:hypothetical protein
MSSYVTNTAASFPSIQGTFTGGGDLSLPTQPGFDGTAPVFFQFRAWSIGSDNPLTFEDRLALGTGFAGYSETISVRPTLSPEFPAKLFGNELNQWHGL